MIEAVLTFMESSWSATVVAGSVAALVGTTVGAAVGAWSCRVRNSHASTAAMERMLHALERALRGEPKEVFDTLRREADDAAAPPALYFAMAAALRRMGMTERSAQVHRGILARGRMTRAERVRAQLGLAVDYLGLGRPSLAEEILRDLPRSVRRHPNLLAVRRKTAIEAGDWKEALESTSLMVRTAGKDKGEIADIYARMGEDSLKKEDARAALRSFRRALRKDSGNLRARHGLAEVYWMEGRGSRARKHLIRILDENAALAPLLLPVIRRTLNLEQARDRERYVDVLERFAKHEDAGLWIGLEEAELLLAGGDLERCRRVLENLMEAHPHAFEVHEAYVNFLVETHQDSDALTHLHRVLDLASEEIFRFRCTNCGYMAPHGFFECPRCARFGRATYVIPAG